MFSFVTKHETKSIFNVSLRNPIGIFNLFKTPCYCQYLFFPALIFRSTLFNFSYAVKTFSDMSLERPNPPLVVKVTYYTIELEWSHVKASLDSKKRYKFKLQEANMFKKTEWSTVYTGLGFSTIVQGLEPSTVYSYRLNITCNSERSEYSQPVEVKTTRQPNSGEEFQRAILSDNRAAVANLVSSQNGSKFFELSDNLGNLPLMILVKRDGFDKHSDGDMLELLIKLGANVNAQSGTLKTALMMAAFYGKLHMVELLKKYGANYELRDNVGKAAVHYAVDGGSVDTLRYRYVYLLSICI